jgi:hypothetical protein
MFTLSIKLESAFQVEVLANLADIIANEGNLIADAESLISFMQYIEYGLKTNRNGWPLIVGQEIIADPKKWINVADVFEEVAQLIRKNAPNNGLQPTEYGG